ncbi:exodeoxyribonuclease V subunit alpha [Pedobacter alpinus]|uniref:RecBCD enzyme subunit RecD n=1 Tax=Pedobacter alpinus TaxID=1590643 RepID=A0ABW5TX73_9SPHI
MQTYNDVHQQFASFFKSENLKPFAYLVSKKLSEGHICLILDAIDFENEEIPPYYKPLKVAIKYLADDGFVSSSIEIKKPFILYQNRLYLQRYFHYETQILERIKAFTHSEKTEEEQRILSLTKQKEFISTLFESRSGIVNWQLAAAVNSYINNFSIITGGPGTGKTTTVAKILAILFTQNPNLKVGLAAPTGKAAARMAESLKNISFELDENIKSKFQEIQPSTLHRLLGYIPDSPYFKHNQQNPLLFDILIVDESSMIDVALFAKLLNAVGQNTKLILLGDKDQLASVEAGSLFGDLCMAQSQLNVFSSKRLSLINSFINEESSKIPSNELKESEHPLFQHIVELQHSHRFNSEEGIGKFSTAIINNNINEIQLFIDQQVDHRILIDTEYNEVIFKNSVSNYQHYILEPDVKLALKKLNQIRVLCAIREGEQGLYNSNRRVEQFLSEKGLIKLDKEFYENRPIMMTSNNYDLGLFNGDIGLIRYDENGVLKAYFENTEGEIKPFLPGLLSKVETVFAMTIHKSQGSEFDEVLILLPQTEGINILTRELLYTGITRAKNKVILQGSNAAILEAANAQVQRASGISNRFLNSNLV